QHQQNPKLLKELAGVLAKIHNLNVPIRKGNNWFLRDMKNFCTYGYAIVDVVGMAKELELDQLMRHDLAEELTDLVKLVEKFPSKQVFCHNDFRASNIMVTEPNQKVIFVKFW